MPRIALVSRESLVGEKWWGKLEAPEQRAVLVETQALTEEIFKWTDSRLGMGEHLENLRVVLEPKRIFVRYLRRYKRLFSVATAYRWMGEYVKTKSKVSDTVLRTAIAHGFDVIDTEMVEKMPPPKTEDRAKIVKYLEKVATAKKAEKAEKAAAPEYDYDTLMKEALNFVDLRRSRVPPKLQEKWVNEFIGMVLSRAGMKAHEVKPMKVPESFKVVRGRPLIKSVA